jgi:hypothetical protein
MASESSQFLENQLAPINYVIHQNPKSKIKKNGLSEKQPKFKK